jgi:hypothetical protein
LALNYHLDVLLFMSRGLVFSYCLNKFYYYSRILLLPVFQFSVHVKQVFRKQNGVLDVHTHCTDIVFSDTTTRVKSEKAAFQKQIVFQAFELCIIVF